MARNARHEGANAIARKLALRFLIEALHLRNQSLERLCGFLALPIRAETHPHRLVARAMNERRFELPRQIGVGQKLVHAEVLHERVLHRLVVGLHPLRSAPPRHDCAFRYRFRRIGDHQLRIDHHLRSEPVTGRAGAKVAVKRKMFRRQLGQREVAVRVPVISRKADRLPTGLRFSVRRSLCFLPQNHQPIPAPLQRRLHRIRQPRPNSLPEHEPIHHRLDRVPSGLFQPDRFRLSQFKNLAIHPHADEAFAFHLLDHVAKLAHFIPHQRSEQDDLRLRRESENLIDDLLRRLAMDRLPGGGIVRLPDGREQNAQVIVYLRRGRNRRPRIRPRAPLFDRDRRRKPFDEIDVRLFHLIEELPGVGGKALDVTPLSLRIESIESERRLARPAHAGNHDQFFPRNLKMEILEIVLACTADLDSFGRHRVTTNVEPVS